MDKPSWTQFIEKITARKKPGDKSAGGDNVLMAALVSVVVVLGGLTFFQLKKTAGSSIDVASSRGGMERPVFDAALSRRRKGGVNRMLVEPEARTSPESMADGGPIQETLHEAAGNNPNQDNSDYWKKVGEQSQVDDPGHLGGSGGKLAMMANLAGQSTKSQGGGGAGGQTAVGAKNLAKKPGSTATQSADSAVTPRSTGVRGFLGRVARSIRSSIGGSGPSNTRAFSGSNAPGSYGGAGSGSTYNPATAVTATGASTTGVGSTSPSTIGGGLGGGVGGAEGGGGGTGIAPTDPEPEEEEEEKEESGGGEAGKTGGEEAGKSGEEGVEGGSCFDKWSTHCAAYACVRDEAKPFSAKFDDLSNAVRSTMGDLLALVKADMDEVRVAEEEMKAEAEAANWNCNGCEAINECSDMAGSSMDSSILAKLTVMIAAVDTAAGCMPSSGDVGCHDTALQALQLERELVGEGFAEHAANTAGSQQCANQVETTQQVQKTVTNADGSQTTTTETVPYPEGIQAKSEFEEFAEKEKELQEKLKEILIDPWCVRHPCTGGAITAAVDAILEEGDWVGALEAHSADVPGNIMTHSQSSEALFRDGKAKLSTPQAAESASFIEGSKMVVQAAELESKTPDLWDDARAQACGEATSNQRANARGGSRVP
jgi:hypothetical protein